MTIERRDAGIVLVLGIFTCGFYYIYWYMKMYEELAQLSASGRTPTGHSFWLDFLLVILTCTLYGVYVDYLISEQLKEIAAERGLTTNDSSMTVVLLDLAAWITGFLTNYLSSSIQQDQLNKLVAQIDASGGSLAA